MSTSLVITIPLDRSDSEEEDFKTFVQEASHPEATLILEVGRPISEEESWIARQFSITFNSQRWEKNKFTVKIVEEK